MAIYYAQNPGGSFGFYFTAEVPLGSIPTPRTLITEPEWKAALALGVELVPDVGTGKPVAKVITPTTAELRAAMLVSRLFFHDACRATSYGGGTVWSALQTRLPGMTQTQRDRYADIALFRRLMPEVVTYFQDASGVNLTDAQLDTLFTNAMALEAA
jgi:hypothetical protein